MKFMIQAWLHLIISSKYHKIVKSLGEDGLLIKKILTKQLKMNPKNKKLDFLGCY